MKFLTVCKSPEQKLFSRLIVNLIGTRFLIVITALFLPVVCAQAQQQNDAAFVSQSVPTTMRANERYDVSIAMRNTGTVTWTRDKYVLRAFPDNRPGGGFNSLLWDWDSREIVLPTDTVAPGETAVFRFTVPASGTIGNHYFSWQMAWINWDQGRPKFGQPTAGVEVNVTDNVPSNSTAPSNLKVTAVNSAINLSWSDNSSNESNFVVERKVDDQGTFKQVAVLSSNTTAFTDARVSVGHTYYYQVRAVTGGNQLGASELRGAYTGTVRISKIVPNDDSAKIYLEPVPGARDYVAYNVANPCVIKYAGGIATIGQPVIEFNNINPTNGADLVVKAVDGVGQYQQMLMPMAIPAVPGHNPPDDLCPNTMFINGQGSPTNKIGAIAQSETFHVTPQPFALTGEQAFFDNFNQPEEAWQQIPFERYPALLKPLIPNPVDLKMTENSRWLAYHYSNGFSNDPMHPCTTVFVAKRHLMNSICDALGVAFASTLFTPKSPAVDISGGRILHATFEVDPRFDGRRKISVHFLPEGDELMVAAERAISFNLTDPSMSTPRNTGLEVTWDEGGLSVIEILPRKGRGGRVRQMRSFRNRIGVEWGNGDHTFLDQRHRFDIYLSQKHIKVMEAGKVYLDQELEAPLPFYKIRTLFGNYLYHSALEVWELAWYHPYQDFSYWWTYSGTGMGLFDERHWDNMGYEVLPAKMSDNRSLVADLASGSQQPRIEAKVNFTVRDNVPSGRFQIYQTWGYFNYELTEFKNAYFEVREDGTQHVHFEGLAHNTGTAEANASIVVDLIQAPGRASAGVIEDISINNFKGSGPNWQATDLTMPVGTISFSNLANSKPESQNERTISRSAK